MKILLRLSLIIITFTLFFNIVAVIETKAQITNEILKRMDAHNKALKSLQASVKMDKYNPQLNVHDISEGMTKYVPLKGRDALIRIDWSKPVEESLAIVNKQYILYQPRLNQALVGKVNDIRSAGQGANDALAFINMSKMQLRANYNVSYLGRELVSGGTETWHLQLAPKIAQSYKTAELWVASDGMPVQSKVIEYDNDSTTISLFNFTKNETINTSAFTLNLPGGVKKISDGSSPGPGACFKPAPGDALKNWSDTVFSGQVIAAKGGDYTLKIERVWKGIVAGEMVVKVLSPENNFAVRLTTGQKYIVFARNVTVEGKIISGLLPCSLTSNIFSDSGKRILKEIGIGKSVKKGAVNKKRVKVKNIRKRH